MPNRGKESAPNYEEMLDILASRLEDCASRLQVLLDDDSLDIDPHTRGRITQARNIASSFASQIRRDIPTRNPKSLYGEVKEVATGYARDCIKLINARYKKKKQPS